MRILVVEDDSRMAELLRQGLAEDGHTVTVALNGVDGLAMAQPMTQQRAFDLLLLDVMLPGLSGLEVARRLRARLDRTPILMLMARDSTSDIVQGLDIGADDYRRRHRGGCAAASVRALLPGRRNPRQRQWIRMGPGDRAGNRQSARQQDHGGKRARCRRAIPQDAGRLSGFTKFSGAPVKVSQGEHL
jgi:DNA-binding response OmpR family regulator